MRADKARAACNENIHEELSFENILWYQTLIVEATSEKTVDISILVPFYNEALNLEDNYRHIYEAIASLPQSFEIIYVNDGSTDGGLDILRPIAAVDPRVKIISFVRNFGQTAALDAFISHLMPITRMTRAIFRGFCKNLMKDLML
jgi:cellulose synthase/poly-beta-1,6-N-acetylglucosamine synthase-like glycosyltransferase